MEKFIQIIGGALRKIKNPILQILIAVLLIAIIYLTIEIKNIQQEAKITLERDRIIHIKYDEALKRKNDSLEQVIYTNLQQENKRLLEREKIYDSIIHYAEYLKAKYRIND